MDPEQLATLRRVMWDAARESGRDPSSIEITCVGRPDAESAGFFRDAGVDRMSISPATGDLQDIHDYTLAATEASVTTQLTVAVRNRALEAFNEIMRMPIG